MLNINTQKSIKLVLCCAGSEMGRVSELPVYIIDKYTLKTEMESLKIDAAMCCEGVGEDIQYKVINI